jgi:hypothetical protein
MRSLSRRYVGLTACGGTEERCPANRRTVISGFTTPFYILLNTAIPGAQRAVRAHCAPPLPNGGSGFDLWDQLRPAVEDRQDLVLPGRRQTHRHASDPEIAIVLQHVEVLWRAAQRH